MVVLLEAGIVAVSGGFDSGLSLLLDVLRTAEGLRGMVDQSIEPIELRLIGASTRITTERLSRCGCGCGGPAEQGIRNPTHPKAWGQVEPRGRRSAKAIGRIPDVHSFDRRSDQEAGCFETALKLKTARLR